MIGGGKVKFKTKAINAELLGNLTKVLWKVLIQNHRSHYNLKCNFL